MYSKSTISAEKDKEEEEEEGLLDVSHLKSRREPCRRNLYFLISSICLNVLLGALLLYGFLSGKSGYASGTSSYEHGFHTDLSSISDEIELVQVEFGGGIHIHDDGRFSMDTGGGEYVGKPSPEVDEAWHKLLTGLNLDLDGTAGAKADTYQWPEDGKFFSGLEVYHSLHCLNRLRQALYPDVYSGVFGDAKDPSRENHVAHCINHLRQAIQCHSDVTPMQWKQVGDQLILETGTRHTCRNFDKIHQWASSRQTKYDDHEAFTNGSLHIVD